MKDLKACTNVVQKNKLGASADQEFYQSKDAAVILGVSVGYLYQLMHRNEISYWKPNGKLAYFSKSDLTNWITRNRISSTEELSAKSLSYLTA